jgi:hypothetical protein
VVVSLRIGPLAQAGLNEALSLAIGLRGIWFGSDVPEAEPLACSAESKRFVAGTVVGHHSFDLDAETFIIGESGLQKASGAALLLVGHDFSEGDARVVVDGDMDELPTEALPSRSAITLPPSIAGDAMADTIDPAELFDVDVDHLTRLVALVASHRLRWLQRTDPIEPEPL